MARILVVDDEELARFTIRDILETAGHDVDEAANGNEAISYQTANPFDLIITDIIMPEKEGVETIIELKRDYPDLKIIAISGGGRTKNLDFLKLADEFGADKILAKPFSEEELLERVNACLAT
ncbi:MAG: response regulator [Rhodospirillaceae bacterium]|jgi:CheY-like chemotaxis protein|nr:response regulator [Rhodospirillaceae bacterium]|tara:strand:- start:333 stop:701 length:369 start_codon:yes stop_codon:yes gene_type:complete